MLLAIWTRASICCAVIVTTTRTALYDCFPNARELLIPQTDPGVRSSPKIMNIEKFEISTPESDLVDLKDRLSRTRWPKEVSNSGWSQGTDLSYLKELAAYWEKQFDWRLQEAKLNRFSHFRAQVKGLKLHFIHEKGKGPRPIPLALIHGWPSSFAEMLKVIPLLTDPGSHGGDPSDSFDVIVPSLPGYGYSDAPGQSGMSIWRAAELIHQLMQDVLGYSRFVASGGDWGAYAASYLGYNYAREI